MDEAVQSQGVMQSTLAHRTLVPSLRLSWKMRVLVVYTKETISNAKHWVGNSGQNLQFYLQLLTHPQPTTPPAPTPRIGGLR